MALEQSMKLMNTQPSPDKRPFNTPPTTPARQLPPQLPQRQSKSAIYKKNKYHQGMFGNLCSGGSIHNGTFVPSSAFINCYDETLDK